MKLKFDSSLLKMTALCLFIAFSTLILMTQNSCKTAEGCQMEDKYQAKTDKNGNLSTARGKSNLWSKKQRKRMSGGK